MEKALTHDPQSCLQFVTLIHQYHIIDLATYENLIKTYFNSQSVAQIVKDNALCQLAEFMFSTDPNKAMSYLSQVSHSDKKCRTALSLTLGNPLTHDTGRQALTTYQEMKTKFVENIMRIFPEDYLEKTMQLLDLAKRMQSPLVIDIFMHREICLKRSQASQDEDEPLKLLEYHANPQELVDLALMACVFSFQDYVIQRKELKLRDNVGRFFRVLAGNLIDNEGEKIESKLTQLRAFLSEDGGASKVGEFRVTLQQFSEAIETAKSEHLPKEKEESETNSLEKKAVFQKIESILDKVRSELQTLAPESSVSSVTSESSTLHH